MKTTPLRQKLIEILTLKGYAARTIETYVCVVRQLAKHYHRAPDVIRDDEIRAYLLHRREAGGYSWNSLNVTINGLRFFYSQVLQRDLGQLESILPRMRQPVRRPEVYSLDEVRQLLQEGFVNPKYRAFFMTLYGAGLRLSEACHLQVRHLDGRRMLIRVEQGKGAKDRYTVLPDPLLKELHSYCRVFQPRQYLFYSQENPDRPLSDRSAQVALKKALQRARLPIKGGPHCLRHSFATHMVEAGVPIYVLKNLMGHTSLRTTAGYLHISREALENLRTPLDLMSWSQAGPEEP